MFFYTHFPLSQSNVNNKAKWIKGQGEACQILM
jgi:hypothetical protein